jgi:hypothetical protein
VVVDRQLVLAGIGFASYNNPVICGKMNPTQNAAGTDPKIIRMNTSASLGEM